LLIKLARGRDAVEKAARLMGWSSAEEMAQSIGESVDELAQMWQILGEVDITLWEILREGYTPNICENIALLIHNRVYPERAKCYRKGDEAYITESEFERLL
jgi:hypothetical protein